MPGESMSTQSSPSPWEVACDESGSEGEHLIGGNTDVFAHGSVRMSEPEAAACVAEVRLRIGSPATEYKANHLLRPKHGNVLAWLLGPDGPLLGRAYVHLTDKTFAVLTLLVDELASTNGAVTVLRRDGRARFGDRLWDEFLERANSLLRSRNQRDDGSPVDAFFSHLAVLHDLAPNGTIGALLARLEAARPAAEAYRERLVDDPAGIPALEPLIPALICTVEHWRTPGRPVSIVHDETNTLTPERLAYVDTATAGGLASLRLVDSQDDARVQVADFLAGIARRISSDALNGRADPALARLIRPYVDASSRWGDPASWALLSGAAVSAREGG